MKQVDSEILVRRLLDHLRAELPRVLEDYSDEQIKLQAPQLLLNHDSETTIFPAIKVLWQVTDYEQLVAETEAYELRKTIHTCLIVVMLAGGDPEKLVYETHRYVAAIEHCIQSATLADKALDSNTNAPTGLADRLKLNFDPVWKILRKYEFESGSLPSNKSILVQRHLLDFEAQY
jgi:hypothetical protein